MVSDNILDVGDPEMRFGNILDCAKDALVNLVGGSHINAGMLL